MNAADGPFVIPNGNMNTFAVITEMVKRAGVSQRTFARRMGVQASTLSQYLSGVQKPPKMAAHAAIFAAMCFGVAIKVEKPGVF